jgi:hypothetical protein
MWGPVKENDRWRIRYNEELYKLYHKPCISAVVKLKGYSGLGILNIQTVNAYR